MATSSEIKQRIGELDDEILAITEQMRAGEPGQIAGFADRLGEVLAERQALREQLPFAIAADEFRPPEA